MYEVLYVSDTLSSVCICMSLTYQIYHKAPKSVIMDLSSI